jgi:predicted transcriptional regulator
MASIIIPKDLEQRLAALADSKHLSLDTLTSEALKTYIQEQELFESEKEEDEARWQRYLRTGDSISRKDMSKKLQSLAQKAIEKSHNK